MPTVSDDRCIAQQSNSILLHICCGPCSLMPIIRLRDEGLDPVGFFYNPNIHPLMEYMRRREACHQAAQRLNLCVIWPDTQRDDAWNIGTWLAAVNNPSEVEDPTGPARCHYCYRSRLLETARVAKELGFPAFTSSLLYSRMQRHDDIREAAEQAASQYSVSFVYRDFRADWQAGIDLSKEWELYRQNYCGCIYSEAERFEKKLNKLRKSQQSAPSEQNLATK